MVVQSQEYVPKPLAPPLEQFNTIALIVSSLVTLDLQRVLLVGFSSPMIDAYEPLIPTLVVESAIVVNIMVIAPTQRAKIDTPLVTNFHIILINIILVKHLVAPTSPHGGIYFDDRSF